MPLYDYRCPVCGPFEKWRRLDELDQPVICHGPAQRIFSPPMILNSGSLPTPKGEPRWVKSGEREPTPPRHYSQQGRRPWMISH